MVENKAGHEDGTGVTMKLINDAVRKMFVGQYENVAEKIIKVFAKNEMAASEWDVNKFLLNGEYGKAMACIMWMAEISESTGNAAEEIVEYVNGLDG